MTVEDFLNNGYTAGSFNTLSKSIDIGGKRKVHLTVRLSPDSQTVEYYALFKGGELRYKFQTMMTIDRMEIAIDFAINSLGWP